MVKLPKYAKAVVAAVAAVAVAAAGYLTDGSLSYSEIGMIVLSALGALGVLATKNSDGDTPSE